MSATLIEHGQYVDDAGIPIALGLLYIGTNGADPVATAGVTTIFSDRELTVAITNPQTLGTDGRSGNKIWVSGTYSIQVNDSAAVQKFQDLDAGSDTTTVNTSLFVTSVIGSNTITGVTSDPLSAYISNQQFVFETAAASTGAVTLNVDGVGAKAVVKNDADALVSGDFAANQVIIVVYNATNDNFEWVNSGDKAVADATTTAAGVVEKATTAEAQGGVTGDKFMDDVLTKAAIDSQVPTIIDTEFNVSGSAGKFACRAWVVFDGVGTVSIYASGNVSSITDNGVGIYQVNFATALPDANYSFAGTAEDDSLAGSAPNISQRFGGTRSTTALQITVQIGIVETDLDFVCVQVIR